MSQLSASPTAEEAAAFCIRIVEQTHPYAAAYKPNSAFFEAFGSAGFDALMKVMKSIPTDIPIILDNKRGDIDTTAQAYASASFDIFDASAVTLSPYMGWDSVQPFVTGKFSHKGAFILCKTSNPSSKDLQEQKMANGEYIYQSVAKLCNSWNETQIVAQGGPCVGLVAGATDIPALTAVRIACPDAWILCPGVGAQGGDAPTVCGVGLRKDGSGLLVSVSRGISKAPDMAKASLELRDEINAIRESYLLSVTSATNDKAEELLPYQKEFIEFAVGKNVLQFGTFKLKSGRMSPYFFNAGLFCCGQSMMSLSRFYAMAIRQSGVQFDVIFGPAYKGIPLATSVAMAWYQLYGESKDITYNRKEAKDHGEGGQLVGASMSGRRVLVVDDVITAGTAIRESVDILRIAGAHLAAVAVMLDRQEKATDTSTHSAIQVCFVLLLGRTYLLLSYSCILTYHYNLLHPLTHNLNNFAYIWIIQQVEQEYGIPVLSIVRLKNLVAYVQNAAKANVTQAQAGGEDNLLQRIQEYRSQYGVEY